jgi:chromosome segregation ATPase
MDKTESTVPSKKKHTNRGGVRAKHELRIAWVIAALFLGSSLLLVMQLRNVDRAEQAKSNALQRLSSAKNDLSVFTKQKGALEEKVLYLQKQESELSEKIAGLRDSKLKSEKIIAARNQASNEFGDLVKSKENIEKSLIELKKQRDDITTSMNNWQNRREAEAKLVDGLQERKLELTSDVNQLEHQEQKHRDLDANIQKKEAKLRAFQERLTSIGKQLTSDDKRLEWLTQQNQKLDVEAHDLDIKRASLHTDISNLRQQETGLKINVNDLMKLRKQADHSNFLLAEAKLKISDLNADIDLLKYEKDKLKKDVSVVKVEFHQLNSMKMSLSNRESTLMVKEKNIDNLMAEISTLTGKRDVLSEEINNKRKDLGSLSEELRLRQNEIINFNPADPTGGS